VIHRVRRPSGLGGADVCKLCIASISLDGRFIPQPDIGGSAIDDLASSTDDVRSWTCFDSRQRQTSGLSQLMLSDPPSVITARH
jgi:hypothetical protein